MRTLISEKDFQRLQNMLRSQEASPTLQERLQDMTVISQENIPPDIVTMRSKVHLRNLNTGHDLLIELVYVREADLKAGKISVCAPLGSKLLAARTGEQIKVNTPAGEVSYEIIAIPFQPEAEGQWEL